MILVSIIFLVAIWCLQVAQEAPDLPLAVAPTGTGLAHLGGHVGAQNQLPMHFLAQDHLWVSVTFCYLPVGVISNHPRAHQIYTKAQCIKWRAFCHLINIMLSLKIPVINKHSETTADHTSMCQLRSLINQCNQLKHPSMAIFAFSNSNFYQFH